MHYLPYKFEPRPYQQPFFHAVFNEGKRFSLSVEHRRAGKDKKNWNVLIAQAIMRPGNYHYVFPELGQARRAIWEGIDANGFRMLDHCPKDLLARKPHEIDLKLNLINGSTIQCVSASRVDMYMGMSSHGAIFSEAALQDPLCLEYFMPMLVQTGGFLHINTTPRGHNHIYRLWNKVKDNPEWYTCFHTVSDTRLANGEFAVSDADLLEAAMVMSREKMRQEYFCDWDIALEGAYFSDYIRKAIDNDRVYDFTVDPSLPVHTFWDLGLRDNTSICFVQFMRNGDIKFVDFITDRNKGINSYVNLLHDWRDKHGVTLGKHFAPHDINKREMTDGISRIHKALTMGINFIDVPRPPTIEDNVEWSRTAFPQYHFNKSKCQYMLDCMMAYTPESRKPGKDHWPSHATDAFMLVGLAKRMGLLNNVEVSTSVYMPPKKNRWS